ncbi:MAG TPA: type VII secretion target [Pseudonocardiaceae bacterium]
MTGFGVDIGQLGVLAGRVSGIGGSLTSVAGAVGGIGNGDFGHSDLNQAVQQFASQVNQSLAALGKTAGGMTDVLHGTAQSYASSDQSSAENITGTG